MTPKKRFSFRTNTFEQKEKIILRDFLALERTTLANERTIFAYLRSSVYFTLAGIAFLNLEEFERLQWIGYLLFALSLSMIIFGLSRYYILKRKLRTFYRAMNIEPGDLKSDKKTESDK